MQHRFFIHSRAVMCSQVTNISHQKIIREQRPNRSMWKCLTSNVNLLMSSNGGISRYRQLKRIMHTIRWTRPMCRSLTSATVFFMTEEPKLWRNCRATSLWRFTFSVRPAAWRIWATAAQLDMSRLQERFVEINLTIWACQLFLNSHEMFPRYV